MGSGLSSLLFPCFKPPPAAQPGLPPPRHQQQQQLPYDDNQSEDLIISSSPLDDTQGLSFSYHRSNRFVSPAPSDRFSPSQSLRFSPPRQPDPLGFKSISGASVGANSSAPRTILQLDSIYDDAAAASAGGLASAAAGGGGGSNVSGFESTASFSALPLQRVPRGGGEGLFLSGPLVHTSSGAEDGGASGRVPFSAPLGEYARKKRPRRRGIKKAKELYRNLAEKKRQRPWVVPVLSGFANRRENSGGAGGGGRGGGDGGKEGVEEDESNVNVQWASAKAGEDRVHVVVSEELGWLFVGIYDGFNGPDAPEFLMVHLYRAVYKQLQGLFWEIEEDIRQEDVRKDETEVESNSGKEIADGGTSTTTITTQRRRLWEYLAEDDDVDDGLDLSGSDRFAFSVDDAIRVGSNAGSAGSRRWLLVSKLKEGLSRHRESKLLFPWKFGPEGKREMEEEEEEKVESSRAEKKVLKRKKKVGPVEPELVLAALSRALEMTELAYLDMTDKVLDTNPELALMGSCLLVTLMRDDDVYVMNVGDSRAVVAQYESQEVGSSVSDGGLSSERIDEGPAQAVRLTALQLSTDHSTSIEEELNNPYFLMKLDQWGEEIIRIKNEHPDDNQCIVNDRVKGRLKVTRAFGAGFLKQPKLNDAMLEMFRNEYIGTAPYLSCSPSLCHHQLSPRDQFVVLSSDGLYQYLTNQEVVSLVESFLEKFPEGDPAQHLVEEVLSRAAKKAGLDLHDLLDIPQGDRRKYHDDVTVMVISLEGRIWKSSGKYL
ncbi:hypothetical protein Tsubulata_039664 [Turnera subulata]|uniref:protein-serine/threonine phosphatase n=1 Tax=Turnera subulata TaxID=218843 RepID=A0A9Q0FIH0_9ROSI|nr:hypothetical protein Tsubulata_039664 [Turnera subulata]